MSYNSASQGEEDTLIHADYSGIPFDAQNQSAFGIMSPNLELHSLPSETMTRPRTVSRDGSGPMRHPTPDLQSLQGGYASNIDRLEQSAERLSMSSDIGEEIRKMREEQKRSDSRTSSILSPHPEGGIETPSLYRQLSYSHGSHASNSIVGTNSLARNGGFSPAAYFASPRSSIRSRSWSHHNSIKGRSASQEPRLSQVTEPVQEGKPLDFPVMNQYSPAIATPDPVGLGLREASEAHFNLNDVIIPSTVSLKPEGVEDESMLQEDGQNPRPSTETARQRNSFFEDFDGVHTVAQPCEPLPSTPPLNHQRSSPMLTGRPQSSMEPAPEEDMVYYPAPVPMMLNLPQRLSKLPAATKRDKRRSQMLSNLPPEALKSAAWLPGMSEEPDDQPVSTKDNQHRSEESKRRTMTDLPPQLRASMFFDYPSIRQDVEVKGGSAVATLDSILDASAFAPVSAFTDHPIVGHLGAEIYGDTSENHIGPDPRQQKRSSTLNILVRGDSSSNLLDNTKKHNSLMSLGNYFGRGKSSGQQDEPNAQYQELEGIVPNHDDDGDNDLGQAQEAVEEEPQEKDKFQAIEGQPTTLLAELQLRKKQQKLRNRTAATAFPDGMHSTLMQLDAVAQFQKQARNQRHTTLAWEDSEVNCVGPENANDEDVPLGMLYPSQRQRRPDSEDRPLGLIARRQIEDSEPLSHRRARLRGEDLSLRDQSLLQQEAAYPKGSTHVLIDNEARNEDEDEHPGETLAQRIRRIKATKIPTQSRPVSGDFASEILSQLGAFSPSEQPQQNQHTEPPPTNRKPPDPEEETLGQRRRRLQAEVAALPGKDRTAGSSLPQRRSMADLLQKHPAAGGGVRSISNELKFAPAPKTRNTAWAMQVNQQAGLANAGVMNGLAQTNGNTYAPHPIVVGQKLQMPFEKDLRQREMVDRWRQSVL